MGAAEQPGARRRHGQVRLRDLRAFLDALRRENDLAVVEAEADPRLEIPEIHRRVIEAGGPALLFRASEGRRVSASSRTSSARAKRASSRSGAAARVREHAARERPRSSCRRRAGKLWGARARSSRGAARRARAARERARHRGRETTPDLDAAARADRSGPRTAARSSRCRSSTRSIPGPAARSQPRHVPDAGPRRAHDRHALADRQGRRLPLPRRRGARRGAAAHGLPRRAARAHPRARSRRCPRTCPSCSLASLLLGEASSRCPRRRAPAPRSSPTPSSRSSGTCRRALRQPEGPFGDHYGYYSLRHDYPVFQVEARLPPQGRDLPGDRRRQAAAGGLLHRRLAAGAPLAALPARDAVGVVTSGATARPASTRSPRPSCASATAARRWRRRSGSSARASSRSRSSCS